MATLTRGVCLAIPRFFAIALAELTTPRAIRPCPPSFSLANTKTVSPSAICFPPYIVFCATNENAFARGSGISALIANAMIAWSRRRSWIGPLRHRQSLPGAHQQQQHDADIQRVPCQPVGEGCAVGTCRVEDRARNP